MHSLSASDGAPSIILDTNVVLDWLLFADRGMTALAAALESNQLRWLACRRMRDEFEHTLLQPQLARWSPHSERLLTGFDRYAVILDHPPGTPGLQCDDPDDQVFVDLAVQTKASWLISHDRAVLRLRRRAALIGLKIAKPGDWSPT